MDKRSNVNPKMDSHFFYYNSCSILLIFACSGRMVKQFFHVLSLSDSFTKEKDVPPVSHDRYILFIREKTHAWFVGHRTIVHWCLKHCSLALETLFVGT